MTQQGTHRVLETSTPQDNDTRQCYGPCKRILPKHAFASKPNRKGLYKMCTECAPPHPRCKYHNGKDRICTVYHSDDLPPWNYGGGFSIAVTWLMNIRRVRKPSASGNDLDGPIATRDIPATRSQTGSAQSTGKQQTSKRFQLHEV